MTRKPRSHVRIYYIERAEHGLFPSSYFFRPERASAAKTDSNWLMD